MRRGEGQGGGRLQNPILAQIHGRLDLNTRQARRFSVVEELRQPVLEVVIDAAAARPCIRAREHPLLAVISELDGQHVEGKMGEVRPLLRDRDVGHVALATSQLSAVVRILEHGFEPPLGQQRDDERRQPAWRGLANQRWQDGPIGGRRPAPLKAIVCKLTERNAVPSNREFKRCLVAQHSGHHAAKIEHEELLSALAFAIPVVLACERPDRICCGFGVTVLLNQALSHGLAHRHIDRSRMLTAQAERLQKSLP